MSSEIVAITWFFQVVSLILLLGLLAFAFLAPSKGHTATCLVGLILFVTGLVNLAVVSGATFSFLAEQVLSIVSMICFSITAAAQAVALGETWYQGGSLNRSYGLVRLGCCLVAILGIAAFGVALSDKQVISTSSSVGGLSIAVNVISLCTLWSATWYAWQPIHGKASQSAIPFLQRQGRAQDAWRLNCYVAVLAIFTIVSIIIMALSMQYNNAAESAWLCVRLLLLLSCHISMPSSWCNSPEYSLESIGSSSEQKQQSSIRDIPKFSFTAHNDGNVSASEPPPPPAHGPSPSLTPTPPAHTMSENKLAELPSSRPASTASTTIQPATLQQPALLLPPVLPADDSAYRIPSVHVSGLRMSQVWSGQSNY
ncbi:hypothetical protein INT43_002102 [Umbelopsis isabellina]|uniref:Uncharacterized protein n=1 Tax=Mortierella isabellina TaxID=91625 RepID=A0A8H7PS36_MORIS|nr:hypothetical protein INT43_002102 [Umbelopsis isabellina]